MIRGTKRPVPQRHAQKTVELRASIHNRFDVEVIDAATGELTQKARAFNVICDTFWTRLFNVSGDNWRPLHRFLYVLYGGGSGTPAATDTELCSQLGALDASSTTTVSMNRRTGIGQSQAVVTLNAEDAVGDTITELGIGYDQTHCVTHALLQDMNGNPISITKTDTDVIKIYATVFVHWPDVGWYSGAANMVADSTNMESFIAILAGAYRQYSPTGLFWFRGASRHTGDTENLMAIIRPTISAANKSITVPYRYAAADGNLPVRAINLIFGYDDYASARTNCLVLKFGSWFTPPAISGEAVGTGDGSTVGFATAFPVKSDAAVFVDGVAASGCTVRGGPADAAHMEQYFNQLVASDATAFTENGAPIYAGSSDIRAAGMLIHTERNAFTAAYENPYSSLGVASFACTHYGGPNSVTYKVQASDDCIAWSDVGDLVLVSGGGSLSVPAALRTKKYFRFGRTVSADTTIYATAAADVPDTAHNIVFDTPPAAGAVVTAGYVPDCIAKDENHVLDLTVTFTVGEYQEV